MLKRIAATFTLLLMSIAGTAVIAAPAQADVVWAEASTTTTTTSAVMSSALAPTCPIGKICLHTGVFWDGTTFVADPWILPENTCFNFNSFWDNNVNSLWYDEDSPFWLGSYAEIYEGPNCTIRVIARAMAGQYPVDQMRSCNEGVFWDGPCGPPNNVSKRASSWAFDLNDF